MHRLIKKFPPTHNIQDYNTSLNIYRELQLVGDFKDVEIEDYLWFICFLRSICKKNKDIKKFKTRYVGSKIIRVTLIKFIL